MWFYDLIAVMIHVGRVSLRLRLPDLLCASV